MLPPRNRDHDVLRMDTLRLELTHAARRLFRSPNFTLATLARWLSRSAPMSPRDSTIAPTNVKGLAPTNVRSLAPTRVSSLAPTRDSTIAPTRDSTIANTLPGAEAGHYD